MSADSMKKKIEQLLDKSPFAGLSADLKLAMQAQLQSFITDANLVTREEFDIQAEVLRRTADRLNALEQRLDQLETPAD